MKDKEYNKYAKLDLVKCDTPEKAEIIKNLPKSKEEHKEIEKPKFNPTAWKDKEKLIKEMVIDCCSVCAELYGDCNCKKDKCPSVKLESKRLIENGWIKPDKNSVVLSREEYEKLKLDIQKAHNKGVSVGFDLTKYKENQISQERKKMAEKILNEQYQECKVAEQNVLKIRGSKNDAYYKGFSLGMTNTKMHIKELAEQLGVEIKEN